MDEKKLKEEHFSNFKRKIVKDKSELLTVELYITAYQTYVRFMAILTVTTVVSISLSSKSI